MQPSTAATDAALARALTGTPYRYVGFLGSGGMATVVEAEHLGLAKRVVVKLLREELCARPDLVDCMRIEAQALARLSHPNLVQVFDFGVTANGRAYLAMERLVGRTLAQELVERSWFPLGEGLELVLGALRGLAVAQEAGIVHRDIKPQNLFLCDVGPSKLVKVLDFGIAKVVDDAELSGMLPPRFATREGVSIGTPHYGAPEQIRGGVVSPATDVYAMGIVLYECLAGRHPFAEYRTLAELQHAQLVSMPRPPSEVASQAISPAIDRLVLRAMAKAPADRYSDALAFAREIEALLAGVSLAPTDVRDVPTQKSHERPIAMPAPAAPTLLSVSAPAATLPLVSECPRPEAIQTAPFSLETTLLAGRAPPPTRGHGGEVLGVVGLAAGFCNLAWHTTGILMQFSQLLDPITIVTSARGVPPAEVAADVSLYLRLAGGAQVFRHLLLSIVGATLVWLGVGLLRKRQRALVMLRTWSTWSFGIVVFAALIDLALVIPLQAHAFALVPTATANNEVLERVGLGIGLFITLLVPVSEIAVIAVIRSVAGRLAG